MTIKAIAALLLGAVVVGEVVRHLIARRNKTRVEWALENFQRRYRR